jgi:hypothetical protein
LAGDEADQEKLKIAVKVLLQACDFSKHSGDFFAAVKEEFKKSLTVESVINLQENMMLIINKWYSENGFRVSEDLMDDSFVVRNEAEEIFFTYPGEE